MGRLLFFRWIVGVLVVVLWATLREGGVFGGFLSRGVNY